MKQHCGRDILRGGAAVRLVQPTVGDIVNKKPVLEDDSQFPRKVMVS